MKRGEIWWADLPDPSGSEPGHRRPVVVISADSFNRSTIATVVVAILTTNTRRALDPGNVALSARRLGLLHDSVINVAQLATLDKRTLTDRIGRLSRRQVDDLDQGLRLVLGLPSTR